MPQIIDYPQVLSTLSAKGFRCLYHNSGSFGLIDAQHVKVVGWIGPDDATIRPAACDAIAHKVAPPFEFELTALLTRALLEIRANRVWIMPGSHWAYELEFGSARWLPESLSNMGINSADLISRNNASALEFDSTESAIIAQFVTSLIANLSGSDFKLALPDRDTVCTIHHHQQFWWETTNDHIATILRLNDKC